MKVYLDNCCYNRPFDDQHNRRVAGETLAKMYIQDLIVNGKVELVWSYVLELENENNPFIEKQTAIRDFSKNADYNVIENKQLIEDARRYQSDTIKEFDALHLACAKYAHADFFITTDDKLLKYTKAEIKIINPVDFTRKWMMEEAKYE
jgi:predicted nucleic acid-binding protein